MSTQETDCPDCQEKVGLKRKPTGPPRLLLGKSKSREKADSQRRMRRDKCCEDTPENKDQQQDDKGKDSPQKEQENMESQHDAQRDNLGILEENQGNDENMENKAGVTRSTSKTTMRRTFSLLWCSGTKRKESDNSCAENVSENKKNRNKAHKNTSNSLHDHKPCDANNELVGHGKRKRNIFLMMWPVSKSSSFTSGVNLGRRCEAQDSANGFQERTTRKVSFKKIYRIFPRRKKAHLPVDQPECGTSKTTHNETGDQLNRLTTANTEIPSTHEEEQQKQAQEIKASSPETFTFNAEVSINTNIESGHFDDEQEIYPHRDEGGIVLSTTDEEKRPALYSSNEVLQTSGVLGSCCCGETFDSELPGTSSSLALDDTLASNDIDQMDSTKNAIKCKPVITIERAYSSEEENQEVGVNEAPRFDFLSMNGSWKHLKINSLTNNTLHPSDLYAPPELDQSRCNEALLIQTAISMVQSAVRAAVEQLAHEQQLDRA